MNGGQTVSPPMLWVMLMNLISPETFLSQTVYIIMPPLCSGGERNLTEVDKNCEKNALREFKVIQGHQIFY